MEDKRFEILKTELLLTQQNMDKYDQFSTTIKTWMVTLWSASTGWAIISNKHELFWLGVALVLMFLFFDGLNKTFRKSYKRRRDEVASIMAKVFDSGEIPKDAHAPRLPTYDLGGLFKNTFEFHIILPHLVLIAISVCLLFSF